MISTLADLGIGHPVEWAGVVAAAIAGGYGLLRYIFSAQEKVINRVLDRQDVRDLKIVEVLQNHMSEDREALSQINQHMGGTVEALRQLHEDVVLGHLSGTGKKKRRG